MAEALLREGKRSEGVAGEFPLGVEEEDMRDWERENWYRAFSQYRNFTVVTFQRVNNMVDKQQQLKQQQQQTTNNHSNNRSS